jgi:hypothetical protein
MWNHSSYRASHIWCRILKKYHLNDDKENKWLDEIKYALCGSPHIQRGTRLNLERCGIMLVTKYPISKAGSWKKYHLSNRLARWTMWGERTIMYSLSATASALKDYTSTSYILQKNKETVSSNLSVVERESLVSEKKMFRNSQHSQEAYGIELARYRKTWNLKHMYWREKSE